MWKNWMAIPDPWIVIQLEIRERLGFRWWSQDCISEGQMEGSLRIGKQHMMMMAVDHVVH
jgi:hypothetical protein